MKEDGEAELFARVKRIFALVLPLPAPERGVVLARECGEDVRLRRELEELLRHASAASEGFLEGSAAMTIRGTTPARIEIPGFRLLALIDSGASGIVYRAEQERPRREVAIKVLRLDALAAGSVARFQREAEILARFSHPGIARVHEVGVVPSEAGALPWIAMELVHGRDLGAYVHAERPRAHALVELFVALCDAVEHAHRHGIVHRDLKPSNVLVEEGGHPKVLDFGIARILGDERATIERTRTGLIMGTLNYMAPEQVGAAASVGTPTDVHALGTMLFECLTDELPLPVAGADQFEAMRILREVEPARLRGLRSDLPQDLETILIKALEKDPARRYPSAGALGADLANWLANRPVLARRPTLGYQVEKFVRRNRALTVSATAVILTLSLGLAVSLRALRQTRAANANANQTLEVLAAAIFDFVPSIGFGEEQRPAMEDVERMFAAQLAREPANPVLRLGRARALIELATLDQTATEFQRGFERADAARALLEALVAEHPDELDAWTQLSRVYAKLGEARRDLGDHEGEVVWFRRAYELDQRLVEEHPGDPELVEDLGWSLCRMCEQASRRGDRDEAFEWAQRWHRDALHLVEAEPENWKYVLSLAKASSYVASGLKEQRRIPEAIEQAQESLRLTTLLVKMQPNRRDFVRLQEHAYRGLSEVMEAAGDQDERLRYRRLALTTALDLALVDPRPAENLEWLWNEAVTFLGIALGLGRPAEAQWIAAPLREVARLARRALGDERWIAPLEELSARCEAAGLEPTDAADVARGR